MFETTINDGTQKLWLKNKIAEVGRVDAYVVAPVTVMYSFRYRFTDNVQHTNGPLNLENVAKSRPKTERTEPQKANIEREL